jgi:broad specificity phosphatase PhoE
MALPVIYVARHGETEWSRSGQHTGVSDIPLTESGQDAARKLGSRLSGLRFVQVFTSPLLRARHTCELAGFGDRADILHEAMEWNYGRYEGVRTVDIHRERPGWDLFRDGCPEGETAAMVGARADRVIAALRQAEGDALLFSSSHFLRVLAARWLGLEPSGGRHFMLDTAALSVFDYEHNNLEEPVIRVWNDTRHLQE